MAVRAYTILNDGSDGRGIWIVRWEGLTKATDDTGAPYACPNYADKSIQLVGTLGAAGACTIQGSNMKETPTYATLNDPQANALVMTALGIEQVLENTYWIRPSITAGDATTDLDVYLLCQTTR